jgi:mediator of RNA polymerase II transcription subunit 8
MDMDQKKLDESIDSLITRCADLKNSIASLLFKLESASAAGDQSMNWSSFLDSYALISGQLNMLMRFLKNDPTIMNVKNLTLLPIRVSPDADPELTALTESRVMQFSHEVVPNYLRTKQEPEIESQERQFTLKANTITPDVGHKAVITVNKIVTQVCESVKNWKEEWDSQATDAAVRSVTSSAVDTNSIISAITMGRGVKGPPPPDPKLIQQQQQQAAAQQQQQAQQQPAKGKAPTVRTNIKTSVHPYQKN